MDLETLVSAFSSNNSKTGTGRADSFSDKLSSKYTVSLLTLFAIIASSRLIIDEPISCFCPTEFTDSQIDFAQRICWTQKTYHLPNNVSVKNTGRRTWISYYQWVNLILALQAFIFYLPNYLWKMLSKKSGLALSSVTDASSLCQKCPDLEEFEGKVKYTANTVSNYLHSFGKNPKNAGIIPRIMWIPNGNFLTFLYMIIKCIYMTNAVGQLFMLNAFLGYKYNLFGLEVLRNIQKKREVFQSKRFPRFTLCTVSMRVLGEQYHTYEIQCALPMNMMYEMMFLIIWFWLIFVMVVTAYSLLKWLKFVFFRRFQFNHILEMIGQAGHLEDIYGDSEKYSKDVSEINNFVMTYLKRDGCFILQMIEENAGGWVASKVTGEVWLRYLERKAAKNAKRIYLEVVKILSDEGIEVDKGSSLRSTTTFEKEQMKGD